ncbi:MAG: TrkA family potassium uptake protein [Methanobacteriaceae archaeon]|nr:TrkA family potassium uptake protein [Methanobacteriaceae archaeon]
MKIIVVGGGKVGSHLINLLLCKKHDVTMIEKDHEHYTYLTKEYDEDLILEGNGTNRKILEKAGISEDTVLVATTSSDETNLLLCLIAKEYNVKKIISRIVNPISLKIFKKLGIDEVISPELTACSYLEKLVTRPQVADLTVVGKGNAELIDLTVKSKKIIGKRIDEVSPTKNYMIVSYYKNGKQLIPQNDMVLHENDKISLMIKTNAVKKTMKKFTKNGLI